MNETEPPIECIDRLDLLSQKLDLLLNKVGAGPPRFLSIKDAAIYSGLSDQTIRRLIATRKVTVYRPVRGRILLDRQELTNYILSATRRPAGGRGAFGARS